MPIRSVVPLAFVVLTAASPGRKTDVKDCEWIAHLLQVGLLRGSDIPSRTYRELRDLTRHRTKLVQQSRVVLRIIKPPWLTLPAVRCHGKIGRGWRRIRARKVDASASESCP